MRKCTPDDFEEQGGSDSPYLRQKMSYDETVAALETNYEVKCEREMPEPSPVPFTQTL